MKLKITSRDIWQFVAYFIGGGVWFWSGYIIFALCYGVFHWHWLYAKILADIVGWTLNYVIQRYWAFATPRLKRHEMQNVKRYAGLTAANLVLDYLIIGGLKAIGITPYVGFFISSGFFTAWNYVWYKYFVFANHKQPNGPDGVTER